MYRVKIKSTPLWLFSFQQCVQISEWHFTTLLSNNMYTLSPSHVELYLKMTMLFQVTKVTKTAPISQRSIVIQNWLQAHYPCFIETLQIWTHMISRLDYHVWSAMLEKYHDIQPKPNTTDELMATGSDQHHHNIVEINFAYHHSSLCTNVGDHPQRVSLVPLQPWQRVDSTRMLPMHSPGVAAVV